MSISSTSEFKLATIEAQRKALGHKNNFVSSEEAASKVGLETKGRVVNVKCSDDKDREISVDINYYTITPTSKYKKSGMNIAGIYTTVWMIKGSSPTAKNAIYFTAKDLDASESFKQLKAEIDSAFKKFKQEHEAKMKEELSKSHSQKGKKALEELKKVAQEKGAKGIFDWFKAEEFKMDHVHAEDFEPLVKSILKENAILDLWILTSKKNAYGHHDGDSIRIDWQNHTVTKHGWDSGD